MTTKTETKKTATSEELAGLTAEKAAELASKARAFKEEAKATAKEAAPKAPPPLSSKKPWVGGFSHSNFKERLTARAVKVPGENGEPVNFYQFEEIKPGKNPAYAESMNRANLLLAAMLRPNSHWGHETSDKEEQDGILRVERVVNTSVVYLLNEADHDAPYGFGFNRHYLVKAYADFVKATLKPSELILASDNLLQITSNFSMYNNSTATLTDIVGTTDTQGSLAQHRTAIEPTDYFRKRDTDLQSELRTEIEALSYSERKHFIDRDVHQYLMGASGMHYHMPHYSRSDPNQGQLFDINVTDLTKIKVSFQALSALRSLLGNRRRFIDIFNVLLRQNRSTILSNVVTLATLELYPTVRAKHITLNEPTSFAGFFEYPHQQEFNEAYATVDTLRSFTAELRKDLRPVHDFGPF